MRVGTLRSDNAGLGLGPEILVYCRRRFDLKWWEKKKCEELLSASFVIQHTQPILDHCHYARQMLKLVLLLRHDTMTH